MSYLLDTNVVSEIRKKAPDPGVSAWFASVPDDELFLSVLVVGEIRQGIERLARRDLAQAEIFEQWLSRLVHAYGDRIVPITARVAEAWGRLNVPDPVPVVDGLMAATALVHDWTLVTRNVDDVCIYRGAFPGSVRRRESDGGIARPSNTGTLPASAGLPGCGGVGPDRSPGARIKVTATEAAAITAIAAPGDVRWATTPAMAAPTPCIVSMPEECSPRACPLSSPGVSAIRRSWRSRLAEYPTEASTTAVTATGSAGCTAKTRYGAASSRRSGAPSRSRHRGGTNRPVSVSPASMPRAAEANRSPACLGA